MSIQNYYNMENNLFTPRSTSQSMTIEILQNELYWISSRDIPNKSADSILIFSDQSHRYQPFNYDFGPLHLGEVYKFVNKVESALRICRKSNTKVCIFTGVNPQKQVNSVFLVCSYLILVKQKTVDEAYSYFKQIGSALPAYRDATADPCSKHKCYLIECLRGLKFAQQQKWFDFNNFDVAEYDYISQKGNGDYNDIVTGKMIAFSGPLNERPKGSIGQVYTPEDYVPLFKILGVTLVVRLNDKQYNEQIFIQNGIDHLDLIFDDGSTPSDDIVNKFLEASEKTKGVVAVHCKSGFGRTGTLIGMYAMKHFKIQAKDFIGWMRIVRPGSIHGPQHEYLVDKEQEMFELADQLNNKNKNNIFSSPVKKNSTKVYGKTNATPIKNDNNTSNNKYNNNSGSSYIGSSILKNNSQIYQNCSALVQTQNTPERSSYQKSVYQNRQNSNQRIYTHSDSKSPYSQNQSQKVKMQIESPVKQKYDKIPLYKQNSLNQKQEQQSSNNKMFRSSYSGEANQLSYNNNNHHYINNRDIQDNQTNNQFQYVKPFYLENNQQESTNSTANSIASISSDFENLQNFNNNQQNNQTQYEFKQQNKNVKNYVDYNNQNLNCNDQLQKQFIRRQLSIPNQNDFSKKNQNFQQNNSSYQQNYQQQQQIYTQQDFYNRYQNN